MSEFLLELYSEEIPPQLQINARTQLKQLIEKSLEDEGIKYNECLEYSTPTRLTICIKGLPEKIKIKSKEVKGPKTGVPENILQGFTKSHNVSNKDIFKKQTEKGEFYFIKIPEKILLVKDSLVNILPKVISAISWKKSMKWSTNNLMWGRPLRSILAIFKGKKLPFKFQHLDSKENIIIEQDLVIKSQKIKSIKEYFLFLRRNKIVLDQNERQKINVDAKKLIEQIVDKYDLPDESKAIRCLLDYVEEKESEWDEMFATIRCNRCG